MEVLNEIPRQFKDTLVIVCSRTLEADKLHLITTIMYEERMPVLRLK